MVAVILEVEYAVETVEEARALAHRDAGLIFRQPEVLAVQADAKVPKGELPITERYLADE